MFKVKQLLSELHNLSPWLSISVAEDSLARECSTIRGKFRAYTTLSSALTKCSAVKSTNPLHGFLACYRNETYFFSIRFDAFRRLQQRRVQSQHLHIGGVAAWTGSSSSDTFPSAWYHCFV